jgi:hypothetical protein
MCRIEDAAPRMELAYIDGGSSFAVIGGERRPIVIWSVVKHECCRLVHFSLHSRQPVGYGLYAKYTARLVNGEASTTQILCGSFRFAEDFELKLKEVFKVQAAARGA